MLVTSEHIMNELAHVFQKPYFQRYINTHQIDAFFDLLKNEALVTPMTVKIHGVATHPEDDLTLATAVSAKANYLVTGDKPLVQKVGNIYQGVTLLTPNEFLENFTY